MMDTACGSPTATPPGRGCWGVGAGPMSSVRWQPCLVKAWGLVQHEANLNQSPCALCPWRESLCMNEYAATCGAEISHYSGRDLRLLTGSSAFFFFLNTCVCPSVTASLQKKKIWQIVLKFFSFSVKFSAVIAQNKQTGLEKICISFSFTAHTADSLQLHISNNLIFISTVGGTKITHHQEGVMINDMNKYAKT